MEGSMKSSTTGSPNGRDNQDKGKVLLWVSRIMKKGFIMTSKYYRESSSGGSKVIHSVKVGIALVLVSLLYLLDPLFEEVGENAMWAIMTVVVVFEFTAGATLSKGINRAIGTILGGGLGCLAAILGHKFGKNGNPVVVGTFVFFTGAAATYLRLVPRIRRRYDYGAMIFILTFNLVAVSGVRADIVMKLAKDRLATIGMGFAVCIFTSLLIFPIWASDQLHHSTASKFETLASCISGCLDEYFTIPSDTEEKKARDVADVNACKSVFHSKSSDESLANFAKWEPWHGKFGFLYPWEKYLEIGEVQRELAALILSLKVCIQSSRQLEPALSSEIREPCGIAGLSMAWILRELGESISSMKICRAKVLIAPKLHSIKLQLTGLNLNCPPPIQDTTLKGLGNKDEHFHACSSLVFLLTEITNGIGGLAEQVEQLGQLAYFQTKTLDV